MAWTAPMTFVSNTPLTASQLNVHLRDNLLETAPAKATQAGGYIVSAGLHQLVERVGVRQTIAGEDGSTTQTNYDDLEVGEVGPTVTAQTSGNALVIFGAEMRLQDPASPRSTCRVTVDVTGDTTIPGTDTRSLTSANAENARFQASHAVWYDDLNPGENTFQMKYKVSAGTGFFQRRRLIVFPL